MTELDADDCDMCNVTHDENYHTFIRVLYKSQ